VTKETFDQYAIDKLSLLHQLNLPESDTIHLLISGISQSSLRATALSVADESLDSFLEKMRCITEGASDGERKSFQVQSTNKARELMCRNCGKKGYEAKSCNSEAICFYCKATGHRRFECPKLGTKSVAQGSHPKGTQLATPVTKVEMADSSQAEAADKLVALVKEDDDGTRRAETSVKVISICKNNCSLVALFDTGSPVSFVRYDVFLILIQPHAKDLRYSN